MSPPPADPVKNAEETQDVQSRVDPRDQSTADPSSGAAVAELSGFFDHGRFLPGTLLQGRYRIVGLVGKGGMGEVYRADDLKLGQEVALKFLPEVLADDRASLTRFHNEVRIARQIAHPNVCRVYDIGTYEGQHFLSMEYVDGEDLASLLRRIGRFPEDKAIEMAHQLCRGLAAAHERGILHRDMKPSNVMVDGRGKLRITDFGLAGIVDQIPGKDIRAGTPAYMAPEQLLGEEVTIRSDLYSLGLVLYEMFTGKSVFNGSTFEDSIKLRDTGSIQKPSLIVEGLDPVIERVILHCLKTDPKERPTSVLDVVAPLPGGDPLALALQAGETPSPETVAASGEAGVLSPLRGIACLLIILLGLGAVVFLARDATLIGQVALEIKPEVLEARAREIVRELAPEARARDSAYGFDADASYLRYLKEQRARVPDGQQRQPELAIGPQAIRFWFRQSPQELVPHSSFSARVALADPPPLRSGMVSVILDSRGRLLEFSANPPQVDPGRRRSREADWSRLFELAGLDSNSLDPCSPLWNASVHTDHQRAWRGQLAEDSDLPVRVEASSYRGKPVSFKVVPPWKVPESMEPSFRRVPGTIWQSEAARTVDYALGVITLLCAAGLARRNLRLRRSDWRGALRLAVYLFFIQLLTWAFQASHVPDLGLELELFYRHLMQNVYTSTWCWFYYIALEPYVRRLWPQTLVSWSRFLSGHVRDPLVGRDMLIGSAFGVSWVALITVSTIVADWLGAPEPRTEMVNGTLVGARYLAAWFLYDQQYAVIVSLHLLLFLLLLRVALRKRWLVASVFVIIWTVITCLGSESYALWSVSGVIYISFVVLMMRFGFLASITAWFTLFFLIHAPIAADFSAWYVGSSTFALLTVAGLGAYGLIVSLAGRPIFHNELFQD